MCMIDGVDGIFGEFGVPPIKVRPKYTLEVSLGQLLRTFWANKGILSKIKWTVLLGDSFAQTNHHWHIAMQR